MKKFLLSLIICAGFFSVYAQDFTVMTLPDIQNMTWSPRDQNLYNEMQYVIDTRESLNTQIVVSLGDLTAGGYGSTSPHSQWQIAKQSSDMLFNAGIPYAVCIGNHDMDYVPAYEIPLPLTRFNQYYPVSDFTNKPYFGGYYRDMSNGYYLFSASGMDFIVLSLQNYQESSFDPSVATWANNILAQYADRRAIISTHMLNPGNKYMTEIIEKHDNVFLAVYGHDCGDNGERFWTSSTPSGNTIYCIMADYQCRDNEGGGAVLRWYTFKPEENKIYAYTYSTYNNRFETDANSQFTLDYEMDSKPCEETQKGYQGKTGAIPGTIEAEDFNEGCHGDAYFDSESINQGNAYRNERVDIETCDEGGYNIGWIQEGEWLNFEVDVASSGKYTFEFRVASEFEGSVMHIEAGGVDVSGAVNISASGGWQIWKTVTVSDIQLNAGVQNIKLFFDAGPFNLNYFTATKQEGSSFTIGVMPDTQNMSKSDTEAEKIKKMTQFFIERKTSLNIQSVVSVGDMIYGYNSYEAMNAEYARVKPAYDNLKNAGIPYVPCMGNHDHDLSLFNEWFPVSEIEQQNPYFSGYLNGAENTYYLFSEGGTDYVMVVIETHDQFIIADHGYDYDMASINWANNIFSSYPSRKGIFVTHDIFEPSGYNLVEDVIKKNDNLFMAICGHSCARAGFNGEITSEKHWVETSPTGNKVHCIMANYQCDNDNGATVRYYTFKPEQNKIEAYTYNVVTNQYITDENSQFVIDLNNNVNELPIISNIQINPLQPQTGETIAISATITDDNQVASAVLKWGTISGSLNNETAMSATGDVYSANIPAQNNAITIFYSISASDNENSTTISPEKEVDIKAVNNSFIIPGLIQAEDYNDAFGVQKENTLDENGGENIGWTTAGDWMKYNVEVGSKSSYMVEYRVAGNGGKIDFKLDGSILASKQLSATGEWQVWTTDSHNVDLTEGEHELTIFVAESGFNLNWIQFTEINDNSISVSNMGHSPANPQPGQDVVVTATIIDNSQVESAILYWGISLNSITNTVSMNVSGNQYSATIPQQTDGTTIYYKILAADDFGNDVLSAVEQFTVSEIAAIQVPGIVQAESFSEQSGIKVETCYDADGGENIGWTTIGDWMKYNINVTSSGLYKVEYRIAGNGGKIDFKIDGNTIDSKVLSTTGDWQTWTTDSHYLDLEAGIHELTIYVAEAGFNLNWIKISEANDFSIKIEAEDYVAMKDVKTEACSEGTLNVGYLDSGDWIEYDVNIPVSGTYNFSFRVAAMYDGELILSQNATDLDIIPISSTNGWQNWTTVTGACYLNAGQQKLVLYVSQPGWNINWWTIELSSNKRAKQNDAITEFSENSDVLIYPNPATTILNVKTQLEHYSFEMFEISGKQVFVKTGLKKENSIDISNMKKGLYLLKIKSARNNISKKILIK